jgi:hypothetical protein
MSSHGRVQAIDAVLALFIILIMLPWQLAASSSSSCASGNDSSGEQTSEGIVLVEMNWSYISDVTIVLLFLLAVSLVGLGK